ncbi:MAG: FAD/NAD(P)-binding protein [Ilumatobacteraceae bacterium]
MTPVMAPVEVVRRELADTVTLAFAMPDGLADPEPGQFAMLWVPGVGEIPISYSGIGPDRRVEHTVRAVGPTSSALASVQPGDTVGVRGPFGRGWQLGGLGDRDLLIVAGGLGLAPLRPVVDLAVAVGLEAHSVRLFVGAREPSGILYAGEIEDRFAPLAPRVSVDHAAAGWHGAVGPVSVVLAGEYDRPDDVAALVCGPEVMMGVISRQLVAGGVAPERIQVSLERNMQCGVGHCGHCQLGPLFTCVDGPVVGWDVARPLLAVRER